MNQKGVISYSFKFLIVLSVCLPNFLFSQNADSLFVQKVDSLFGFSLDSLDVLLRDDKLDSLSMQSLYEIMIAFDDEGLDNLVEAKLPFFALEDTGGHLISSDLFEGKISIIHIWSIYNQPSIDQIPLINQLAEAHKESVNVFTITNNSRIEIRDYVYNYNYNQTHLIDAGSYIKELNVGRIPKIMILDDNLIIRAIYNQNDYGTSFLHDEISAKIKELKN